MDIQAQWDALDKHWPHPVTSTNRASRSGTSPKKKRPQSARKVQLSPSRSSRPIPGWSSSSQHTGTTQDFIVLQPTKPLIPQQPSESITERAQRYGTRRSPSKIASQQQISLEMEMSEDDDVDMKSIRSVSPVDSEDSTGSEPDDGTGKFEPSGDEENSESSEDNSEASDEDESASSDGDQDDDVSLSIDEERDSSSKLLPDDSDTEEARLRRLERRRNLQQHDESEESDIGETARNLTYLPIADAVGSSASARHDLATTFNSTTQNKNIDSAMSTRALTRPMTGPIPISSSTNPSQFSGTTQSTDVQVGRSQLSTGRLVSPEKRAITISTDGSLQTPASRGMEPLQSTNATAMSPQFTDNRKPLIDQIPASSNRKRPMSSSDSHVAPNTSPRKRAKFDGRTTQASEEDVGGLASPDIQLSIEEPSLLQCISQDAFATAIAFQDPQRLEMLSSAGNSPTSSLSSQEPLESVEHGTGERWNVESLPLNHRPPMISASQPNPIRAKTGRLLPRDQGWKTTKTEPEVAEIEEAQFHPTKESAMIVEIDCEPLQKILDLRGAEYCDAVQNDSIYRGLLQVFIEFASVHQTYCGSMDHLFKLCLWLMTNSEKIDEEYWDDFVLQHHDGKYNAYVNRCLLKFKQPLSWDRWYQQAGKQKLTDNVLSEMRLQDILTGKETERIEPHAPAVPHSWARFR